MLDAEAALCTREGLIPPAASEAIAAECVAERYDLEAIAREAADHATSVVPLVRALRERAGGQFAEHVHTGATSQDIVDTAAMPLSRAALDALLDDGRATTRAAARLAEEHRTTAMSGRTLLQQALPTSFGLRAPGWLVGVHEAIERLGDVREHRLAVQMGGPVGALSPAIAAGVAAELALAEPVVPWHTIRVRVAAIAGAVGAVTGVLAKVARDVTLLAQNEVGDRALATAGR
jgi:3-carboxy-cis,cis-muconate cycloisomerase